ncbi:MAG: hypothetical protein ABIW76_16045, partial [Fibrobacteria bacterium]
MFGHVVFGNFQRAVAARAISLALILGSAAQAENFFWNPSTALLNGGADVSMTANWSQVSNGGGVWPKSSFDDDFTNTALNGAWKFQDKDNDPGTGNYSLSANPGQLTLSMRGRDILGSVNQYAGVWRSDISGDFDVSVKVVNQSGSLSDWAKFGIIVANDSANLAAGGRFSVIATSKHGIKIMYDATGPIGEFDSPEGDGVGPLIPVFPVWIRAAKKGGVCFGYYKTSQSAPWTLLGTGVPQGPVADSHIGLFGTSHDIASTLTVVLDDFQASGSIQDNSMELSFNGTSTTADSNARLTANLTAATVDMTGYTGTFLFGTSTLSVTGAKADFATTALLNAGTGALAFTAAGGVQVFSPRQGAVFPAIAKSGGGTLQITARPLVAGPLSLSGGEVDLGNLTHQFAGLNATAGSFTGMEADDSLKVTGDADFSGLTGFPTAGSVQIKSQSIPSGAKILNFKPGNTAFNNLYLWAVGESTRPARIVTAAGTLQVKGNLILRDERSAAGIFGVLDFRANNTSVNVDSNLLRVDNGSGASPSQQLLMGSGTWTVKGNVSLSFQNTGSADNSTLDLTGGAPVVQTLTISNG